MPTNSSLSHKLYGSALQGFAREKYPLNGWLHDVQIDFISVDRETQRTNQIITDLVDHIRFTS